MSDPTDAPTPARKTQGLYGKFEVYRTDGSDRPGGKHDGCTYFVLDLQHDKHMVPALLAYADSCQVDYPMLASQLRIVADDFGRRGEFVGIMAQKPALDLERQRSVRADAAASRAPSQEITGATSDGYHTFDELYAYRKAFNALLFNHWATLGLYDVHKAWNHSDGLPCFGGGWFIVVAQTPEGQVSNHYEAADWDLFQIPARDRSAEYDGHTPQVALERMLRLAAGACAVPSPQVDLETILRMEWWFNHGCEKPNLYGDDGEMQCNVYHGIDGCMSFIDFKRTPFEKLQGYVSALRLQRAAKCYGIGLRRP